VFVTKKRSSLPNTGIEYFVVVVYDMLKLWNIPIMAVISLGIEIHLTLSNLKTYLVVPQLMQ
jgi:hypothetical protein